MNQSNDAPITVPCDLQSEVAVVGACLLENSAITMIADLLKPDDFYNEQHRVIYRAMLDLWQDGSPASLVSVTNYLREHGSLRLAGGAAGVSLIAGETPDVTNVEYYARRVKDASISRALQRLGKSLEHLSGDPRDAVSDVLKRIVEIGADSLRSVPVPIGDHVAEAYRRAVQLYRKEIENQVIMTGMPRFDAITGGLKGSDLIVIGARPSVGKSAFALHLSKLVADQGHKVLFISLEMSAEQVATRLLAAESGVPYSRIQDGYLSAEQPSLLEAANRKFINLPLIIDDKSSQNIADIQTKARREMARGGLGMVVVDYLQIAAKDSTDFQQVTLVSNGLKALAKDLNIPVIGLSQLSRGIEQRDNKRPVLSDLKQSGAIEQDADLCILLHSPKNKADELELIVAKHRNGGLGRVLLRFEKRRQQFEEIGGGEE